MGHSPGNRVFVIIEGMDVYLSDEARRHVRAQALEASHRRVGGLLLGHRRGPRFFVESLYPCSVQPFLSLERYRALCRIFDDKIIGFFGSGRPTEKPGRRVPPFTVNKIFLDVEPRPGKAPVLRAAVMEYSGAFELIPVPLASPTK